MNDRSIPRDSVAFRRGQIDFLANTPTPYPHGSNEFRAWTAGWQDRHQRKGKSHVVAIRVPRNTH